MKPFSVLKDPGADWPSDLDHVSATSLTMFARCPEQWRRRYLLGERQRPSGALLQGWADHHAIEQSFLNKLQDGTDLPVADVQEIFAVQFDSEIDRAGGYSEVDWDKRTVTLTEAKRLAGRIKTDGAQLVGLYRQDVSPLVWPVEVEREFTFRPAGVPVDIQGRLDLVALDFNTMTGTPVEGTRKLVERKTSARSTLQPQWRLQARIYQLAEPDPLDFHMSLKAGRVEWGTPELRVETSETDRTRTAELVSGLIMQIAHLHATYGPDEPWPGAITHPWACGFCGWRPTCHWHTNV